MKYFLLVLLSCCLGIITNTYADESVSIAGCNRLTLLLDERLTPGVLHREWASGNERQERPARLELRGCQGELLDSLTFEVPLAQLHPTPLRGTETPTYLLTLDLTAESGSYNGPVTLLIEVRQQRLQQVAAIGADKNVEPIRLALTGKAAWKRIARGNTDHLLTVACQRQEDEFVVTYRRYFPSEHGWLVRTRTQPGFWESDGGFPDDTLFP